MNIKSKSENSLYRKFSELFSEMSESEKNESESQMIMFRFLSEVERIAQERNIKSKKELAMRIGVSPSYLTQLYRGNKKLNFETLARFQQALNIVFSIKAQEVGMGIPEVCYQDMTDFFKRYHTPQGFWMFHTVKPLSKPDFEDEDFYRKNNFKGFKVV